MDSFMKCFFFLLLLFSSNNNPKNNAFGFAARKATTFRSSKTSFRLSAKPKMIVFDLDGCLWAPEMYELAWRREQHSPFQVLDYDNTQCRSNAGAIVKLIADVPQVLDELTNESWADTVLAISSRTDEPDWARELLSKMVLPESGLTMDKVLTGPWEIMWDSKVDHFQRLSKATGISFKEMVFFDNEGGNCISIADLGVTVGYSKRGITKAIFDKTLNSYPAKRGKVIGMK